jgi:hypothetical protein
MIRKDVIFAIEAPQKQQAARYRMLSMLQRLIVRDATRRMGRSSYPNAHDAMM